MWVTIHLQVPGSHPPSKLLESFLGGFLSWTKQGIQRDVMFIPAESLSCQTLPKQEDGDFIVRKTWGDCLLYIFSSKTRSKMENVVFFWIAKMKLFKVFFPEAEHIPCWIWLSRYADIRQQTKHVSGRYEKKLLHSFGSDGSDGSGNGRLQNSHRTKTTRVDIRPRKGCISVVMHVRKTNILHQPKCCSSYSSVVWDRFEGSYLPMFDFFKRNQVQSFKVVALENAPPHTFKVKVGPQSFRADW